MAKSFNVWPGGMPTSYSGESFPLPKTEPLPALYGIDLANPFFLSFLAGAAFVAFFSVTRFNRRSRDEADPVTAESRLLARLTPADMRDRRLIAQAYALYASVLLGVYVALTFYGRIILDWVNNVLPTAGYTDTSELDFGSPQWPLMVALAMIGVLPVLPPVEALEVRLRHWTHRVVGIPLTIYRHSEAMRGQLRRLRGVGPGEVPDFESDIPDWVRGISDPFTIVHAFEARADLILLTPWVMTGRGEWPTGEANRAVEALFDERTAAARQALHDFKVRILDRPADPPVQARGAEDNARHLALRRRWEQASKQMIDARDELLALLAVGAENQSDYSLIESPDLRLLFTGAIPVDRFQKGPQVSLALLLPVLLVAFGFAIRFGWHAPSIGGNARSFSVIALSATYEVLLVVVLFLLPLMSSLNYRFWRQLAYRGRWEPLHVLGFEQRGMVQVLVAGLLALVVSLIGLILLAVAQASFLARSSGHFNRLLFEQGVPLLPATVSLAGVSVIYCLMVLFAVEEKEHGAGSWRLAGMGLACALAILAYQMLHLAFWYNGASHWSTRVDDEVRACSPIFLELVPPDRLERLARLLGHELKPLTECDEVDREGPDSFSRYYNLVSILINALIGFISIACFLPERRPGGLAPPIAPGRFSAATGGLLIGLVLAFAATMAVGETRTPRDVLVGFRADAPPFSSIKTSGEETRLEGYLVDLCTQIFAADQAEEFRMVKTMVTASDRFARLARSAEERWRPGQPTAGAKVDLLCDPVTLRYAAERDEPEGARRTDGIFSPIVYVTGVSYVERSKGGVGTPVLGLVNGTTTRKVALQACQRDAFRNREQDGSQSSDDAIAACATDLAFAEDLFQRVYYPARYYAAYPSFLQRHGYRYPVGPVCSLSDDERQKGQVSSGYRFCFFPDHTAASDWFCDAPQSEAIYYFGDKDLILGQVEARAKAGQCDGVNPDEPFYSYEPYALLVSPVYPDLVRFVQRRIYEIFSDRSQALGMFASNFEGKAMSVPLANLFLLNGVEDEAENAREAAGD